MCVCVWQMPLLMNCLWFKALALALWIIPSAYRRRVCVWVCVCVCVCVCGGGGIQTMGRMWSLSDKVTLDADTQTCTHACIHAYTHTHTHTNQQQWSHQWGVQLLSCDDTVVIPMEQVQHCTVYVCVRTAVLLYVCISVCVCIWASH